MKVFNHPVHIILIHFPSALFPMDFVCSLLALYTGIHSFVYTSFYAAAGGVLLGCLAILTGGAELLNVYGKRPDLAKKILIHGSINTAVITGYGIIALSGFKKYPLLEADSLNLVILKGFLIASMIIGNFIGGSLILKDKIGLEGGQHGKNEAV